MTPAELRKQLLANGYTPLPNIGKACYLKNWNSITVTEAVIDEWSARKSPAKRFPDTGLRIEDSLTVIDLDINHEAMNALRIKLEAKEPELARALVRRGKGHKEAWFIRCDEPFNRIATRRWLAPGAELDRDGSHVVEIFGGASARQFGAFGAHTREPDGSVAIAYEWAGKSPLDTPLDQLPVFTRNQLLKLVDFIEETLEATPGWQPVIRTQKGEHIASRVYDLTPELEFECNDGVVRALGELQAAAGERGLRCSASWLEPGRGHSLTRCLVGKSHDGGLTLWDSATGTTHMPAADAPKTAIGASSLAADLSALHRKLQESTKAAQSEAKAKRRAKLSAEDDHLQAAGKLLQTYAYCPTRQLPIVPLWATKADDGMAMTNFRTMMLPWAGEEEGPRGGIKKINPVDLWASSPERVTVEGLRLRPDRPRPTYQEKGKTYVNFYEPPVHTAAGGDPALGLELLAQLLPDAGERQWFARWLAYKLANPEVPGPAVVMVARAHGTGRGTLGELVRRLFGGQYVRTIGFDHWAGRTYQSQYTDWMAQSLIAIVNESSTADNGSTYRTKHDTYERLKEIIEPRAVERQIITKGDKAYDAVVFTSYLVFTNNPDALPLPANDRRIWVGSNGEPQPVEYWDRINTWMADERNVAAFAQWLLALDLGAYSPYEAPPMTRGKERMTRLSQSDLDRGFETALDRLQDGELFVPPQVLAIMRELIDAEDARYPDRWQDMALRMVSNKCERVGEPNGRNWHPMIDGKRYAVYARTERTAKKWSGEEPELVRREVLRNGSPNATGTTGNLLRGLAALRSIKGGKE
jgi:hypothetical protein